MIIGVILRLVFYIKYYIEYKVKESENLMLSHQKEKKAAQGEISPASVQRMTSVGDRPLLEHQKSQKSVSDADGVGSPLSVTSDDDSPPPDTNPGLLEAHGMNGPGYTIKFDNIGLTLPSGTTIMKGVCGEFKPKRMCAIMGPSGAGYDNAVLCIYH